MSKVFVLGLDGATFRMIDPLLEKNKLPTIAALMKKGVYGNLESTIPPVTGPAWTSFLTGKSPAKHGIFDFTCFDPNSYERHLLNSTHIKAETLAEIASRNGKKVGFVNMPMTYPPFPVNGFMISGILAPNEKCRFTYPEELYPELLLNVGDYRIDYSISGYPTLEEMSKDLNRVTELRKKTILYLMDKYEWDLFCAVFVGIDRIQHWVWRFTDSKYKFKTDEEARFRNIIYSYYEYTDRVIGDILERLSEDDFFIINSDHGFCSSYNRFHLNNWLEKEGFLSFSKEPVSEKGTQIEHFFEKWACHKNTLVNRIDWSSTKAFSGHETEHGIFINLEGKFPQGTVKPSEMNALTEQIREKLLKTKDPETGLNVLDNVYRKEEIYNGPCLAYAPDLILITRNQEYEISDEGHHAKGFLSKHIMGIHHRSGILIMSGNSKVLNTGRVDGISILDLAPTILYLCGLSIPGDIDGKIISNAFRPEYMELNPPVYEEAASIQRLQDTGIYSKEDIAQIQKRLENLGYM